VVEVAEQLHFAECAQAEHGAAKMISKCSKDGGKE
jgi:hypothetical protein